MLSNKEHSHWQKLIDILNQHFKGCPTRLGVFEREDAVVNDYWIESGLPFSSLAMDVRGDLPPHVTDTKASEPLLLRGAT